MVNECQHIEEMLSAFALGALTGDEKIQVERHLENCNHCQQILADYLSVCDGLMTSLPPVQPPARVRAQLLAKTAPKPQKAFRVEWRTIFPWFISVSALTVVMILVILNFNLTQRTNQLLRNQEQLMQQNQANQTTYALMTYPESKVAVIDDGNIYGTLIYDPHGQVAVLNVWGLDNLPDNQTYQIWLIEPDETRISGGTFQTSDAEQYISFMIEAPVSLELFNRIGVTIEPEGGSEGPTGPRVFGVEL